MKTDPYALVTKTEALDYLHRIRTDPSAWVPSIDAVQDLASTVVALHDEVERLRREADDAARGEDRMTAACEAARAEVATLTASLRLAEASVSLLRADLASTADERDAARIVLAELKPLDHIEWTWPDDFDDPVGDKPECICAACGSSVSVEWGMEWSQGRDVCLDCAQMRSEALSAVTRDRDAARMELRRLRAAEAPGTDDEAFDGTGWISRPERPGHGWWTHANPSKPGLNVIVGRARNGRSGWIICGAPGNGWGAKAYPVALDAMRAAVPESV